MPATISHALSATTPDDPTYEIQPKHWNSSHALTLNAVGSEVSGAFNNAGGVTFGLETNGSITAAGPVYQATGNYLTTAMASNRGSDFVQATATFAGTNASGTIASNGISVSVGAYLTTAMASNAATISNINVSAGTLSANRSNMTFADSNGVSWGLNTDGKITGTVATNYQSQGAYLTTAMASNRSTDFVQATAAFAGTNASGTIASNGISVSVAAPGAGATYSNYFAPFPWDENSATSTLSLSNLGVQPFTLGVNLSFGQINFIGSASVAPTSASNNFSARLTNSTQACSFTAAYSVTNSDIVDLYFFSRGTGAFSTELESVFSTRNSWVTYYNATHSGSVTLTNTAGGSVKVSQAFSVSISYPMITSGQSINGATSHTTWGTGYTTWTSTASNNSLDTISTSAAKAIALASTYPATTAWTSNKMIPFNLGSTMSPGEWWIGMVRYSGTSSSSSSSGAFTGPAGTGNSFSTTYAASGLTQTGALTFAGQTATIISSLGWLGFASQNSMAPSPGLGSFSGTYSGTQTYVNNAGNPNGAIALSDVRTQVSFFSSWFQMASNRI